MPYRNSPIYTARGPRLVTVMTIGVFLTIALATFLQLLLVGHFAGDYASTEAQLRLQQLSWQMRDSLNRVVAQAVRDVELVASLDQVRDARDPSTARSVLNKLQKRFPDYAWIGLADSNGKVIVAANGLLEDSDVSTRPWFKNAGGEVLATDYHPAKLLGALLPRAADPWRFIDVSVPVTRADGSRWGVLGIHLSWDWARRLARTLLTPAMRDYGVEIFVVREDTTVLLGPAGMEEKRVDSTSLQLAKAGETGSIRETWPDGKDYLTGFSRTGQSGRRDALQWSILVRQPVDAAMQHATTLARLTIALSVALGFALTLVVALLARRLTAPMDCLSKIIEQRASASFTGESLPAVPEIGTFREAQVLSRAMRLMVEGEERHLDVLEAMNAQLESTVAARTAELERLVMRDSLTGLLNRRALMEVLPMALLRSARSGLPCAVAFLDLDGFKAINDSYGHEDGDEVLREFGRRIICTVRATDTVARLAGDEFVVILESMTEEDDAVTLGSKIMPTLREPFILKSATVRVGASIGIAVHASGSSEATDALLARADKAMYQAKKAGKNQVVVDAGRGISEQFRLCASGAR